MQSVRVGQGLTRKLAILNGLVSVADFIFGALYVDFMLSASISPARIGLVTFLATVMSTVVEVPSGDFGDRFGQRKIATIGLVFWGFSLLAFGGASHFPWVMLVSLCFWSVGQALFSGAPLALVINSIPKEGEHLRRRAIRMSNIANWVGSAGGGLAVQFGLIRFSAGTLIGAAGVILLVLALWLVVAWPESTLSDVDVFHGSLWTRVRGGWNLRLSLLMMLWVVAAAVLSMLLFAWQPLVKQTLGLGISFNGLILFLMSLVAALGTWLTRWRERFNLARFDVPLALTLVSLSAFFAGFMPGASTTVGFLVAAELLVTYCLSALAMDAHGIFADEHRNMLWSIFSAAMGMSMAVFDLVFGLVWDHIGLLASLWAAGAVFAGLSILIWIPTFIVTGRAPKETVPEP